MNFASDFAYVKPKKQRMAKKKQDELIEIESDEDIGDVDTNIISVDFKILKEIEKKMGLGDPYYCSKCKSVLNSVSKVMKKKEYLNFIKSLQNNLENIIEEKEEEKKYEEEKKNNDKIEINAEKKIIEVKENESVWICEFCGNYNKLNIEDEEIPTNDDTVYLIQSNIQSN